MLSSSALPLALVAGTVVLTVAACGGNGGSGTGPTATSPAPSTTAAAPSTSTSTGPTTPAASSPATSSASPVGGGSGTRCAVGALRIRYADDEGGGGAGSVTGTFTFTNTGSTACTLAGFPGVSYVGGGNGTQVGQPATRTGDAVRTRTLEPGRSVKAALRRTQPRNYGDACQEAKVDGFRVYPPDSTESAFVAFKTTGFRSTDAPLLQIAPVR
jgi:hypothetical protein